MVVEEEVGEEVEEVGKREMGEREFVRDAFTVTISTRFFTKPGNCTKPRFSYHIIYPLAPFLLPFCPPSFLPLSQLHVNETREGEPVDWYICLCAFLS